MLKEKEFDETWGDFYEGLNEKSKWALMYNYVFIIRRFLFVFTAFYWYDLVSIQIGFFVLTTEFYCMYLIHARPFTSKSATLQEIFNELTIFFVSYHMICITDFVRDAGTKFGVGYSLIFTVGVNIFVGISNVLFGAVR